jgi:hypothetical protein
MSSRGDDPPNMAVRPLTGWPTEFTPTRRRSPFTAPWSSTLSLRDREILDLGGGRYPSSVLQLALREQDFRLDGLPRAAAKPDHPGVILNVDSIHGALSYPCDRFTTDR